MPLLSPDATGRIGGGPWIAVAQGPASVPTDGARALQAEVGDVDGVPAPTSKDRGLLWAVQAGGPQRGLC